MTDFIWISIMILLVWSVSGYLVACMFSSDQSVEDFLNPKCIYQNKSVNWLGCALLTLLHNALCPILTIGYWIYWLCTVGR